MPELFAAYRDAGPAVSGIICLMFGLVFGSFSSVLSHRIPLGESIVAPRSHCPACRHVLGPAELVPVFSYIWLRGRCRHCRTEVHWRYPLLELACGALGFGGALIWGLGAGMALPLVWVSGHVIYGLLQRGGLRKNQSGMSLVEVLMAGLLLAVTSASVFEFIQATMRVERDTRRQAVLLSLGREAIATKSIEARATPLPLAVDSPTISSDCVAAKGDNYLVYVEATPNNHGGAPGSGVWDIFVRVSLSPPCDPAQVTTSAVLKGVVTRGP